MSQVTELFEYNAWANEQLFVICDDLSAEALAADFPELGGGILELLDHMTAVERAFLTVTTGGDVKRPEPRTYAQVREDFGRLSVEWAAAAPDLEKRLGESFLVPWFGREIRVEQGLTQAMTHSVQHRAGVCAGLARAGREAPNLDYIHWALRGA